MSMERKGVDENYGGGLGARGSKLVGEFDVKWTAVGVRMSVGALDCLGVQEEVSPQSEKRRDEGMSF